MVVKTDFYHSEFVQASGLLGTGKRLSEAATLRDELLHLCVVEKKPSSLDHSHEYFVV